MDWSEVGYVFWTFLLNICPRWWRWWCLGSLFGIDITIMLESNIESNLSLMTKQLIIIIITMKWINPMLKFRYLPYTPPTSTSPHPMPSRCVTGLFSVLQLVPGFSFDRSWCKINHNYYIRHTKKCHHVEFAAVVVPNPLGQHRKWAMLFKCEVCTNVSWCTIGSWCTKRGIVYKWAIVYKTWHGVQMVIVYK